jgi:hypothetical protein
MYEIRYCKYLGTLTIDILSSKIILIILRVISNIGR